MNKINNDSIIFRLTILCVIYFSLLFLNSYVLKFDTTILGVFQELLTIPFLLGTLILLVLSARSVYLKKFTSKNLSNWSLIILLVLSTIVFGSFFISN